MIAELIDYFNSNRIIEVATVDELIGPDEKHLHLSRGQINQSLVRLTIKVDGKEIFLAVLQQIGKEVCQMKRWQQF